MRGLWLIGGTSDLDDAGRRLNCGCSDTRSMLWGEPICRGWTWHIRLTHAGEPLLARLVHRQSMGALTGRAAFLSHGLRSRNRLIPALVGRHRPDGPHHWG